jgi:hypothetical protein
MINLLKTLTALSLATFLTTPSFAGDPEVIHSWNMDVDPGWTMTGEWEWGQPLGLGGDLFGLPDPLGGYSGDSAMGMNQAGDYSTEVGGPYELRTQAIDCSTITDTQLRFHRWLNIDWQGWVFSYIEVSNNGVDWTQLWTNGSDGEIVESAWTEHTYDISEVADGESTVYIRWTYEVAVAAWAYSGWNIDDVEILGTVVECVGDLNGDGMVNGADVGLMLAEWGPCRNCAADLNHDGEINGADLGLLLSSWGGC